MPNNPLRLKSIHHVKFVVGNAKQAAYYYRKAFGFSQFAYSGLETGSRHLASYAMEQGKARFVLATPYRTNSPEAAHLHTHGDGIVDIAFHVEDADAAYHAAVERGAEPALHPTTLNDEYGSVRHSAIKTYGDTIHSFYSFRDYTGPFLPGYVAREVPGEDVGILRVDHMVGNVELGKMDVWADWYSKVLGFARYISFDDKDISTEYSALMSIVMSDNSYAIKFPLNEPAAGKRKSQIDEYLDFYNGPGVQHVALLTQDIEQTVTRLRDNGVEFLSVPDSYYDLLPQRVGQIDEALDMIRSLRILVDRDEEGYLLQLFSRPVEDRPTVFYEIIQRKGSRGFGKGNFRALFEAIEREQALRGNL
ncbi:4-hydroxyphenylpyruvate dioxygenase [Luteitalea pratensis]|uniref:4-hydroxyphenylpyruvate dioxygenase n=1 Tax=Luteitalea pratensis TaxID=1855912 RepID=UPI001F34F7AF|nr:4-hydroxyphenylpyruvate dioxygenase [Luteitalea pratensis]